MPLTCNQTLAERAIAKHVTYRRSTQPVPKLDEEITDEPNEPIHHDIGENSTVVVAATTFT